ncbi:unnamed protein product [Strongylus vulgaris]|uniref:PABS domain-containing protein n=1 Tax=Strongylus vulgaris TaxID=40348 RepID=A0A3P7J5Q9_STRVU|nr:unnamed protein product [Strongylus vulgaris]
MHLAIICSCYVIPGRLVEANGTQATLSEKDFSGLLVKTYGYRRKVLSNCNLCGFARNIDKHNNINIPIKDVELVTDEGTMSGLPQKKRRLCKQQKYRQIPDMTKDTIDTSQWKIDKTYLYESYYILMIGTDELKAMFHSDLIELSRNSTAKILSIGLGGGTIDSFLHEVFPQMDITVVEISRRILDMAKKWFGLVEDDHHRVEIVDGITFLAEKAKIG